MISTSESLWKSLYTCSAFVGDTCPNLLALGAATGTPAFSMRFYAIGWFGNRIPTKPVWAVTKSGITSKFAFTTKVIGPGQYFSPSVLKSCTTFGSDWSISSRPCFIEATCTIRGSVNGLPFDVKMLVHASASSAFAPRPYTVSVGKLTRAPSRNRLAACSIVSALLGRMIVLPTFYGGSSCDGSSACSDLSVVDSTILIKRL